MSNLQLEQIKISEEMTVFFKEKLKEVELKAIIEGVPVEEINDMVSNVSVKILIEENEILEFMINYGRNSDDLKVVAEELNFKIENEYVVVAIENTMTGELIYAVFNQILQSKNISRMFSFSEDFLLEEWGIEEFFYEREGFYDSFFDGLYDNGKNMGLTNGNTFGKSIQGLLLELEIQKEQKDKEQYKNLLDSLDVRSCELIDGLWRLVFKNGFELKVSETEFEKQFQKWMAQVNNN